MEFLALAMFPALLILIFIGLPVAFALMITGIGFGFITFGTNLVHLLNDKVNEVGKLYSCCGTTVHFYGLYARAQPYCGTVI